MAYDRQEESLLRRARAYATGSPVQVDYDNEEDLLNQIKSYATDPRYRNPNGLPVNDPPSPMMDTASTTYDPTLEDDIPYPGNVPQSEFLQSPPQGESPEMMEDLTGQYANDEPIGGTGNELADETGQYANEDPIGGTGNEVADQPFQPGFFYAGSVEGEGDARRAYNAPLGPPDLGGNAYAHQAALDFDRKKSRAEAERQIEYAYRDANTTRQAKAVELAAQFLRDREAASLMEGGMDAARARLQAGIQGRGRAGSYGQENELKTENIRGRLITYNTRTGEVVKEFSPTAPPQGDVQLSSYINQTGQVVPGIAQYKDANGAIKTIKLTPEQERELQATIPIAGENILQSSKLVGTIPQLREALGPTSTNLPVWARTGDTNAPPAAQAAPPTQASAREFKTANDVIAAFENGKIDRATAKKLLADQFGIK